MNFTNLGVVVPDGSFWQDDNSTPQKIDFEKMKQMGAKGVILRAGQNSWLDPDFKDYWKAAREAGLPRGSYWFYDSRTDPAKQANLWHAAICDDLPELGLWTDLEEAYGGPYKGEKYWKQFVLSVAVYFPHVPVQGIYTANWWWQNQIVTDPLFWSHYPLWVAQYGVGAEDVVLPKPWRDRGQEPVFWQFTESGDGLAYGAESLEIDLNLFNGDEAKFASYFSFAPVPDGGTMEPKFYKLATTAVNIRSNPTAQSSDLGDLAQNDVVKVVETSGNWCRLADAQHPDGTPVLLTSGKTVAEHYTAGGYCWATNAYFREVSGMPATPPPVDPPPTSEEYFLHVKDGVQRKFVLSE